ncbi:hypothetical protein ABH15_01015 [Methanoculleus taiwanensis]|uniref:PBS lyase n=1 Tax=Methanoculleus taiwanensis TaxID=1550565 RepID=A0A498H1G2_9EURY|nr:HEAT repeat domain-containing protein [Methanoculleus taiwanensis]RXE56781.1 hypothetical protein ABH15_01015 [Methanoculleus taiwanensis]
MTGDTRNLIAVLRDGTSADRMAAASTLARMGSPVIEDLASALVDSNPRLRMWAAYTLGLIGDPATVGLLAAAAADDDPGVRKWALAALEAIEDCAAGSSCESGCCR